MTDDKTCLSRTKYYFLRCLLTLYIKLLKNTKIYTVVSLSVVRDTDNEVGLESILSDTVKISSSFEWRFFGLSITCRRWGVRFGDDFLLLYDLRSLAL